MKKEHITKNNIFEDLGFDEAESINLTVRSDIMIVLRDYIDHHKLTQQEAAEAFGVDQPQISRLLGGKIENFTIDKLLKMACRVHIKFSYKIAA